MACRKFINQVRAGIESAIAGSRRGIAEATVKVHRGRAMQKMKAGSLLGLGRMADRLKLVPDEPERC